MSTIGKALELLNFFSSERAEIGLVEFQRLTGRDKATTYRHLQALDEAGFLERSPMNRSYRLGPAVLRLAHVRETTVPRRAGVRSVLPALAEATGETAHVSILQGTSLVTLADHGSTRHGARVVLSEAELPLHATASGMAVLAFADDDLRAHASRRLERFTPTTPDKVALDKALQDAVRNGFGRSDEGYELGVVGIAAPLFDESNSVAGAIAIASVSSRVTPALVALIECELIAAARRISHSWGGCVPASLDTTWDRVLADASKSPDSR